MAFELISEAEYRKIHHYKGMEVVHFGKCDWLVLKREKDHMLLLMKDVLEQRREYHLKSEDITWEECTLRKWLNEDFYNNTFTPVEQARILETHLENPDNKKCGTKGGKDTDDKIFLLSLDEAEEYMTEDERELASWACKQLSGKKYVHPAQYDEELAHNAWWWLRSPGRAQKYAAGVNCEGGLDDTFGHETCFRVRVRPALNLKI